MYKDNQEYTAMRLNGTVVREPGKERLVMIHEIGHGERGELVASIQSLKGGKNHVVPLDDLDLASPKLGNVAFEGVSYYISRQPKRNDWRQGLRRENLTIMYRGRPHPFNLPSLSCLSAPVFDDYPSYKMCVREGGAFSRTFSLDVEHWLWYKCQKKVGQDVNGVPVLDQKFMWLKEALDDAVT